MSKLNDEYMKIVTTMRDTSQHLTDSIYSPDFNIDVEDTRRSLSKLLSDLTIYEEIKAKKVFEKSGNKKYKRSLEIWSTSLRGVS